MLVFVLNQAQKANTGKIQTPVYENVREFGLKEFSLNAVFALSVKTAFFLPPFTGRGRLEIS